jgi:hypothetical protein
VVKSAQAFRAHLMDMFEPQDHPNDFAYPGAAPTKPYDSAGYTLAFQMGVKFDRILDGFDGPFEEIKELVVPPPPGLVADTNGAVGFFLSTQINDSFRAVNQLLKAGEEVQRLQEPAVIGDVKYPAGTFFIPRKPTTLPLVTKIAAEVGTPFTGSKMAPGKEAVALRQVRVGLWDQRGGSMPSGWTRWLLERFEFPFKVVYATDLSSETLHEKFDVLIFVDGATSYNHEAELKKFLENGGTVLTIGSATSVGKALGVPVSNHVAAAKDKYYVPTSVLRVQVDPTQSLAWGLEEAVDITFNNSPTFRLAESADEKGAKSVAWFNTKTPLRSGWAWGQEYLDGGVAIIDAKIGKGRLAMFGPLVLFRAQPHGTFKFLFNGIVQAGLDPSRSR